MKKFISLSILLVVFSIIFTSCLFDQYAIKDGKREPKFIPFLFNNFKGHLFWYSHKDKKGRTIRNEKGNPIIFKNDRDSIIYVHGWQGVGIYGWTTHKIMTEPSFLLGPIPVIISLMYNIPNGGAAIPDCKKQLNNYNVAIFDWQEFNNIAENYETSENLPRLEKNLKEPPKDWPNIPENLKNEIEFLIEKNNYSEKIILVAHSIGSQVTLRAYNMLNKKYKNMISKIYFLDPFTTNHFDFMNEKLNMGDNHWITGNTSSWIKDDITNLLTDDVKSKLTVIISTDIGKSWVKNFANPLNIKTIEDDYKNYPFDGLYAWRTITKHDEVINWFFDKNKYHWEE
ncbi:MAG TPA: hypothetical protein PK771_05060 [Spirochaetota bacterium]|nr:hypothetical protein [Spirochaetota bacterium]